MSTSFIYFVASNHDRIKIGMSKDPRSRIDQLQTGNADVLELVGVIEVPETVVAKMEKHLHHEYSHLRELGEWFRMDKRQAQKELAFQEIMLETTLASL